MKNNIKNKNKIVPEEIIENNNIIDLDSIKNITIISNENNNQFNFKFKLLIFFIIILFVILISFLSNSKIFSIFT